MADIGCGMVDTCPGRAYPEATFHGYDIDAPSVEMAAQNAVAAGLDDRVTFSSDDIAERSPDDEYDVVVAFETIHDMAQPVQVLSAVRKVISDEGLVVIMDEAVADAFTGRGDEIEKLMYGFSILICLPDGLSSKPAAGTGTVMRPSTLRGYGEESGFTGFRSLGEAGFFRFYELSP